LKLIVVPILSGVKPSVRTPTLKRFVNVTLRRVWDAGPRLPGKNGVHKPTRPARVSLAELVWRHLNVLTKPSFISPFHPLRTGFRILQPHLRGVLRLHGGLFEARTSLDVWEERRESSIGGPGAHFVIHTFLPFTKLLPLRSATSGLS